MIDRRAATLRRGFGAALVLGCLAIGVPIVLVAMGGVPVSHGLPSWSQVVAALTQNGIPDAALLQAMAVICWLLWLDLAVAVCAEVIAVARGRPVRLPGFASTLQPVAAQLIAATLLAITALSIRPTATPAPGLRAAMAMATVSGEPHLAAVASSPRHPCLRRQVATATTWSGAETRSGPSRSGSSVTRSAGLRSSISIGVACSPIDERSSIHTGSTPVGCSTFRMTRPSDPARQGRRPTGAMGPARPRLRLAPRPRQPRARRRHRHRPLRPPAPGRRSRDQRHQLRDRIKFLRRLPPGSFSRRVMSSASGWLSRSRLRSVSLACGGATGRVRTTQRVRRTFDC